MIFNYLAAWLVGVGTTTPDASSALDVTSTTKGFLMPRMTTTERTDITSPATGLQVYDTDTNSPWYYNGTAWVKADGSKWTNDATNARVALTSLSDGSTARPAGTEFVVTDAGNIGVGTATPTEKLVVNGTILSNKLLTPSATTKLVVGHTNVNGAFMQISGNLPATEKGSINFIANSTSTDADAGRIRFLRYNGNTNTWPNSMFIDKQGYVNINRDPSLSSVAHLAVQSTIGSGLDIFGVYYGNSKAFTVDQYGQSFTYRNLFINPNSVFSNINDVQLRIKTLTGQVGNIMDILDPNNVVLLSFKPNGSLGVGTGSPSEKLEVNGAIKIGSTSAATPTAGTIRFNTTTSKFEGYDGTAWVAFH